jgi:hypothetical protein
MLAYWAKRKAGVSRGVRTAASSRMITSPATPFRDCQGRAGVHTANDTRVSHVCMCAREGPSLTFS